jgi:hypothetical protein
MGILWVLVTSCSRRLISRLDRKLSFGLVLSSGACARPGGILPWESQPGPLKNLPGMRYSKLQLLQTAAVKYKAYSANAASTAVDAYIREKFHRDTGGYLGT